MDSSFKPPVVISLCTGSGGLERGIEAAIGPVDVCAYVEVDAFIIENLVQAMEKGFLAPAPVWTGVETFPAGDFHGKVHGITGGYPCQPFSHAGGRKGDEDARHIWPHIRRHVEAIRPVFCFFENVEGHISLGFDEVFASLRNLGYRVEAGLFTAAEVGAPHLRKRLFILAVDDGWVGQYELDVAAGKGLSDPRSAWIGQLRSQIETRLHAGSEQPGTAVVADSQGNGNGGGPGKIREAHGRPGDALLPEPVKPGDVGNTAGDDQRGQREEKDGSQEPAGRHGTFLPGTGQLADPGGAGSRVQKHRNSGRPRKPADASEPKAVRQKHRKAGTGGVDPGDKALPKVKKSKPVAGKAAKRVIGKSGKPAVDDTEGIGYRDGVDHIGKTSGNVNKSGNAGKDGRSGKDVANATGGGSKQGVKPAKLRGGGVKQPSGHRGAAGQGEIKEGAEVANPTGQGLPQRADDREFRADQRTALIGSRHRWPARPGQPQHSWEPAHVEPGLRCTFDGYNFREDLLRMYGNAVVEQSATLAFRTLMGLMLKFPTDV